MALLVKLFVSFVLVGMGAWGGGTVAIPLIQHQVVEKNHWITDNEVSDIIALSQMTPGPLAVNAATYVGYKVAGLSGAVVCTVGVITPAATIIVVLLLGLKRYGRKHMAMFRRAVGPAVLGLIILAAFSIGRVVIVDRPGILIFLLSMPAFFYTRGKVAPVWILIGFGMLSLVLANFW
jgi:chromate transporter